MIPGRIPGRERWEVEDKLILSNPTDKQGELKIYAGASGERAFEIFRGSTSVFRIVATSTTAQLIGEDSHSIQIGNAGTTSHSLVSNDDLFVSGKLEVDGIVYFDSAVYISQNLYLSDNKLFFFGALADGGLDWSTSQATENTLVFGLGDTAKSIIFCDLADADQDFDHAAQSNPTIFVHSATDPDSANDEWISMCHDVTDGVIEVGSGTLNLGGSTINLVNTTRTAATVTHDAYATIEIGGTEYKFMLGS